MQKKKNIKLLVALIISLVAIISLNYFRKSSSNFGVERNIFQLNNQQEITDVYLKGKDLTNHFSYQNGRWLLNDSLILDQSMRDVFFSVLSRIEIRKPVSLIVKDSLISILKTSGIHTTITFGDEIIKDYWVIGDSDLERSWAMNNQDLVPYQIHIPGYQSYLAGIFNVPATDWRSRFIFNINFALLNKIEIDYTDKEEKLELNYANNFFEIPGIKADSTKIADFLDELAYLQADQFVEPNKISNKFDSLRQYNIVFATIKMHKSSGEMKEITFYKKLTNTPFILAKLDDTTLCLFDYERIKVLFKRTIDFD